MSNHKSFVLDYHNVLLRESDISLLKGPYWLNDNIIGFYFEYLEHEKLPEIKNERILFLSPEVTQLIKLSEPEILPAILDPLELMAHNFCFMALNDSLDLENAGGSHWSLLVWDKKQSKFFHLDSSAGYNNGNAKRLATKMARYLSSPSVDLRELKCPSQNNGYDCGMHVITNANAVLNAIKANQDLEVWANSSTFSNIDKKRREILLLITNIANEGGKSSK